MRTAVHARQSNSSTDRTHSWCPSIFISVSQSVYGRDSCGTVSLRLSICYVSVYLSAVTIATGRAVSLSFEVAISGWGAERVFRLPSCAAPLLLVYID